MIIHTYRYLCLSYSYHVLTHWIARKMPCDRSVVIGGIWQGSHIQEFRIRLVGGGNCLKRLVGEVYPH